jgi:hypothetical protein
MNRMAHLVISLLILTAAKIRSEDNLPQPIQTDEFDYLFRLIKPQPGESAWREIDWYTDVTKARQIAVTRNKPLIIFTAADGSPLGRT